MKEWLSTRAASASILSDMRRILTAPRPLPIHKGPRGRMGEKRGPVTDKVSIRSGGGHPTPALHGPGFLSLEKSRAEPRFSTIRKLAEALDVDPRELLKG